MLHDYAPICKHSLRINTALPPLPAEPFSRLLPLSGQGLLGSEMVRKVETLDFECLPG